MVYAKKSFKSKNSFRKKKMQCVNSRIKGENNMHPKKYYDILALKSYVLEAED